MSLRKYKRSFSVVPSNKIKKSSFHLNLQQYNDNLKILTHVSWNFVGKFYSGRYGFRRKSELNFSFFFQLEFLKSFTESLTE